MAVARNSLTIGRAAAVVYAITSAGVVAFQIALAAGVPWGAFAMGGAFPGQLPPALRAGALLQAVLNALMAAVLLSRAGVALPTWSRPARWLAWVVVAMAALGAVLNLITPSSGERAIWAPLALVMLASSVVVACWKQSDALRRNGEA